MDEVASAEEVMRAREYLNKMRELMRKREPQHVDLNHEGRGDYNDPDTWESAYQRRKDKQNGVRRDD